LPSNNKCLWSLPKVDKGLDRWAWHHNLTWLFPVSVNRWLIFCLKMWGEYWWD
jgi:hypothetical protein